MTRARQALIRALVGMVFVAAVVTGGRVAAADEIEKQVAVLKNPGASDLEKMKSCSALGEMGAAAQPAVGALIEVLKKPGPARASAAMTLASIGPGAKEAVGALIEAAKDEDSTTRGTVADALGEIGVASAEVDEALGKLLEDGDRFARAMAVYSVTKVHRDGKVPAALEKTLEAMASGDADGKIKESARQALESIRFARGGAGGTEVTAPPAAGAGNPLGRKDPLVGVFEGDGIRVEVAAEGSGRYSGAIVRGEQRWAFVAKGDGAKMDGAFKAGGESYGFVAEVKENALTLKTGETKYECRRSAGTEKVTQTPAAGGTAAAKSGSLCLKKSAVRDEFLKGDAVTVLVPQGWKLEGQVTWYNSPYDPARVALRVSAPAGVEQLRVYEAHSFIDGIREAIPQQAHIWQEGTNLDGSEIRRIVESPGDFVKQIIIPRYREDIRDAKVIGYEEQPEMARALAQTAAAQAARGLQIRAGRLKVEYTVGREAVEEWFTCILYQAPAGFGGGSRLWGTDVVYSFRGPKGKVEEQSRMFYAMAMSVRPELKWWSVIEQVRQMRQAEERMQRERVMNLSRYIARVNDQVTAMIKQSYENRSRVMAETSQKFCEAIRGVNSFGSPFETYPVQLPNGYDYAWTSGSGVYVMSNDPGFDPNVTMGGTWERMGKK